MESKYESVKCGESGVSYYGLDDRFTIEQFKNTSVERLVYSVLEKSSVISSMLDVYGVLDSVPEKSDGISSKFYPALPYGETGKSEIERGFSVFCDSVETYENGIVIYLKYPERLKNVSGYDCTYSSAALIIGPEETSFVITDFGIRNLPDYWKDKKKYDVFGGELNDNSKMELSNSLEFNKNVMKEKIQKLGKKYDTAIFHERLQYFDYPSADATEKEWIDYGMLDKFLHKKKETKQLKNILNSRRTTLNNLARRVLGENLNQEIGDTEKGRAM